MSGRLAILVTCPFCLGAGDRESESGEYILRGACRNCHGKGLVVGLHTPAPSGTPAGEDGGR